jgi:hypothetical protein
MEHHVRAGRFCWASTKMLRIACSKGQHTVLIRSEDSLAGFGTEENRRDKPILLLIFQTMINLEFINNNKKSIRQPLSQ